MINSYDTFVKKYKKALLNINLFNNGEQISWKTLNISIY